MKSKSTDKRCRKHSGYAEKTPKPPCYQIVTKHPPVTTWGIGVFFLFCMCFYPPHVMSGEFSTSINIMAKQTYNDNIFLVDEEPEIRLKSAATRTVQAPNRTKSSDFITSISPGVAINYETPLLSAKISGRLDFLRYSNLNDLDDVNHLYSASLRYHLSPYIRLTLDGSYSRDSDPGSETEITGLSYGTTVRKRQNYGAGFEFDLSELSLIRFNYRYAQDDFYDSSLYTDAQRRQRQENDSETHSLNIFYMRDIHDILERTHIYSNARFLNHTTRNTEQNNISMVVGAGYQLSETISLSADVGIRHSRNKFTSSHRLEQRQEEWGHVGHAQLEYEGEWTRLRLKFSHDIQPASGEATMTRLSETRLDVSRRLSEFLTIRGSGSHFFRKRDSSPGRWVGIDTKTLNLGMGMEYELSQYFFLTGNYTYTRKKEELERRDHWKLPDAERNMVFIGLTFKYSFQ